MWLISRSGGLSHARVKTASLGWAGKKGIALNKGREREGDSTGTYTTNKIDRRLSFEQRRR